MITKTDNSRMLILALKKGDTEGYRQLVQLYGESMHQYAQRIVGDPGTAQDIVQDALLRLYKFRKKLDTKLELRGLCFRTVRNLSRNHLRDVNLRRTRETEAEDMRQSNHKRTPELAIEAWDCAEQLSDDQREVIDLRFTFELSRAEIAAVLEIPEGTVATRQRNALAEIKQKLTARSVSPAMLAASPLSGLLTSGGQASLSNPYPLNILNMENVVMTAIRRMKMKTAGLAASAALLALFAIGVVAASITGGSTGPSDSTTASSDTRSTTGNQADAEPNANKHNSSANSEATPAEPTTTPSFDSNTGSSPANESNSTTSTPEPEETLEHKGQPESSTPTIQPENKPAGMAPRFESLPSTIATVGKDYMYVIETHGQPQPEITAKGLPAWLTLEDGLLHGRPSAKDTTAGTLITLYADNGIKPVAEQRFQLLVGTAPVITSKPVETAEAGKAYSYTVTVSGTPAAKITASGLPDWLALKAGILSGTPANKHGGVSGPITITASNDVKPRATQEFKITVNTPPVIVSKPVVSVKLGVEYLYDVRLEGTPAAELSASRLPKWLTLEGNVLSGTPRTDDIGKSKKITLKAKNGIGKSVKQSFKIEVLDDPEYCQVPWTLEDAKKYIHVGMQYTVRSTHHRVDKTSPRISAVTSTSTQTNIVTEVTDKGYTVDWTSTRIDGMKKKKNSKGTQFYFWEWVIRGATHIVAKGKNFSRDDAKIEINGKKTECVQYSNSYSSSNVSNTKDYKDECTECYTGLYPFMCAKRIDVSTITYRNGKFNYVTTDTMELIEVVKAKKKK